ncbi:flagellar motor switch protein FliG [Hyphomicrobium methylovorum]|uniref:FliG C-terminal domain-containing protein n=1 Tax=Hyphomicrobium methylovorum TaxID=84 RepID=UPI0015E7DA58|nr:FliG C-terminal domain-containing protein [Hyphomicrobium methylovorum]MBA2125959.1 flagellar motor switch protein FliG [Hyphomicrobium methylovorum]
MSLRDADPQEAGLSRPLTGPEKVGVLLLALGKERASSLLKNFNPEELNMIVRSTEVMPTISAADLEDIVEEFEGQLGLGTPFVGRPEDVKRLVTDVITENKSADVGTGFEVHQDVWTRLAALPDDTLDAHLRNQSPQVAAFYLDRLGSERASSILRNFSPVERNNMLGRILGLGQVSPQIVEALEASLHEELFDHDHSSTDKHLAMAGILNNMDKDAVTEALEFLASTKPKDAEAIRKMLFKFEDLIRLSAKAMTVLMDGIPVERTVIALQGADSSLQNQVLGALSPRARRMAEAELQSPANVAPRDIADARRTIVDTVLRLSSEGTIEIPDAG